MTLPESIQKVSATKKLHITPSQKKRFDKLATLDTTRQELFNDLLNLYEGITDLRELTEAISGKNNLSSVVKKTLELLVLILGYGIEALPILDETKQNEIITLFDNLENGEVFALRAKLLAYAFRGLIDHENLIELEPILINTIKIITNHFQIIVEA